MNDKEPIQKITFDCKHPEGYIHKGYEKWGCLSFEGDFNTIANGYWADEDAEEARGDGLTLAGLIDKE